MTTHATSQVPMVTQGDDWIAQTALWCRALAAVSLLSGGAVLAFADWNVVGMPAQFYMALIWGAPAPIYFVVSFFIRRARGQVCLYIIYFAAAHALATFASPLLLRHDLLIAAAVPPVAIIEFRQAMPWYLLLVFTLMAGMANLATSAFWARRWLCDHNALSRTRGFEVMLNQQ